MEEQKKKLANPAPLGLLGFGMTTILLNLANAGVYQLNIMVAAMGFALGGLAQIIAGLLEFKQGNTFGGTAFTAYGLFWWSLVIIWWNPFLVEANLLMMGFYLLVWGVFTAFMFVGALKHNITTSIIFGSLATLFLVLALGDFTGVTVITQIAGGIGIFTGLAAFYSAVAQVVNAEWGKKIFPL
jgi:hypothetical protein